MKNLSTSLLVFIVSLFVLSFSQQSGFGQTEHEILRVQKTTDFNLDGKGYADNWAKANWITIPQRATTIRMERNPAPIPLNKIELQELSTKAKVLYSESGVYFLFQNEDRILNATVEEDFVPLWWEDVVEIFLWPDEVDSTYFEYQLSPLNYEYMIRISRDERIRSSLPPFNIRENSGTRHMTSVSGGEKLSGASITQWTAEIFIPYQLLYPVLNNPPESGARWRFNLYRNDYDTGDRTRFEWQKVNGSNHNLDLYGTLLFE